MKTASKRRTEQKRKPEPVVTYRRRHADGSIDAEISDCGQIRYYCCGPSGDSIPSAWRKGLIPKPLSANQLRQLNFIHIELDDGEPL